MPVFEYHCTCGLHFEKMRSRKNAQVAVSCPKCQTDVQPLLSSPGFAFANAPVDSGPQNTGVAALDFDFDRVIGRDAERRWDQQEQREDYKQKILQSNPGVSMGQLSRTWDGDYRVINEDQLKAANTARGMHHKALEAIKKHADGKKYLAKSLGADDDS